MPTFTPEQEVGPVGGKEFEPMEGGRFEFKVDEAGPHTSAKGNECIKLTLLANNGERDVRVFDYLTFSDAAKWKVKQALDGLGFDTSGEVSVEPEDLLNRTGVAEFEPNERGYLQVKKYYPAQIPAKSAGEVFGDGNDVPF